METEWSGDLVSADDGCGCGPDDGALSAPPPPPDAFEGDAGDVMGYGQPGSDAGSELEPPPAPGSYGEGVSYDAPPPPGSSSGDGVGAAPPPPPGSYEGAPGDVIGQGQPGSDAGVGAPPPPPGSYEGAPGDVIGVGQPAAPDPASDLATVLRKSSDDAVDPIVAADAEAFEL